MERMLDIDPDWFTDAVRSRFMAKVEKRDSGCEEWVGAKAAGYGRFRVQSHLVLAHRVAVVIATGQRVRRGAVIDHLCRNPACVNPNHLDVVSYAENTARGSAPTAGAIRSVIDRGLCGRGHDLSVHGIPRGTGGTRCQECERIRNRVRDKTPERRERNRRRSAARRARSAST